MTAWPIETCHEAETDRIGADRENNGDLACLLCGPCRGDIAGCRDCSNALGDEFGRKLRQSLIIAFRPAFFDTHIAAFDKAGLRQPLPEGIRVETVCIGGRAVQESDKRPIRSLRKPRTLLRLHAQWPGRRRAAEKCDELAPPHAPLPPGSEGIVAVQVRAVKTR